MIIYASLQRAFEIISYVQNGSSLSKEYSPITKSFFGGYVFQKMHKLISTFIACLPG